MFLFLMQFLINYLDRFLGKGLSIWIIMQVITYQLAWMLVLAIPMGVLFSTLMTFGNLSSNSEVAIIKSSGGSLAYMIRPVIFWGIILTGFVYWFNNYILPESNHQAKVLMSDITRKKPTFALEGGQFSSQLNSYTILARKIDPNTGTMFALTIFDNSKINTQNVINADSGFIRPNSNFDKMILSLYNGEIHQSFASNPKDYRIIDFSKLIVKIPSDDFTFKRSAADVLSRGDRELNINDMQNLVTDLDTTLNLRKNEFIEIVNSHFNFLLKGKATYQGITKFDFKMKDSATNKKANTLRNAELQADFLYSSLLATTNMIETTKKRKNQYIVEIQKKYSIPFACLIFVLIGAPLGIVIRRGNFGVSAIFSLGFYIFYWIFLMSGEKLADRDFLSPVLGMWLGNIVISVFAIFLIIRVNFETFNITAILPLKKNRTNLK